MARRVYVGFPTQERISVECILRMPDAFPGGVEPEPATGKDGKMPIRQYLNGETFDPETTRLLGLAFEFTVQALHNWGVDDPPARQSREPSLVMRKPASGTLSGFAISRWRRASNR